MLPDPLHSRLPVIALAPWRSATDGLNPECHRLRAKGSDSTLDYDKARRGGR